MTTSFAKHVSTKTTPQTRAIPGREAEMTSNDSGGVVFKLDKWKTLERFLIIGTEGGTYYASEEAHTIRACESLKECVLENPRMVVDILTQISDSGRALKNDPALFALAYVMAFAVKPEDKFYARQSLNKVARIGTHILHFAQFIKDLKGWGTGTKKAFQRWYLEKSPERIAFQYMKYTQRDGWSHRDLLRLSHPYGTEDQNLVFNYITKKDKVESTAGLPQQLKTASVLPLMSVEAVAAEIVRWNLPREVVPTEMLNDLSIWNALLPSMGLTAMIRNLGKMTSIGMFDSGAAVGLVFKKITDLDLMAKARVHPLQILFALKTYSSGSGFRGSLHWHPNQEIVQALEFAFDASFGFVPSTGKRHLVALDVSGSMNTYRIANSNVTCREAAAVLAMITVRREENCHIIGFSTDIIDMKGRISPSDSFLKVMKNIDGLPFSGTDCAAPMQYAIDHKLDVDMFSVYTDNETHGSRIQPSLALKNYRSQRNIPNAKLAVVGMVSSPFTIADPKDPYMVDVVGFDTDTPQLLSMVASL